MSAIFVISDEEEETPLQTDKVRGANGYQNVYEDGDSVKKRMYVEVFQVEINNQQREITEQESEKSDEDITYVPDDNEEEQFLINPIRCMIHDIIFGAELGPSPKEFPYEKLEKIEELLVKRLKNISYASETSVWEFVLTELRCIRFAYDRIKDIDLKTDAKFNLILIRILGQYVNFRARKTAVNKHLKSSQINEICKEVWMQIVGLVGSNFIHVIMVILRTEVKNYPLDVLLYPLCKMIHARLLRETPDNFPRIIIIIVAVLFYKNWLLMCTRKIDRQRHKNLAKNSLEMNFPEKIGQLNGDFECWKRVDDRIRQDIEKITQRNAREWFGCMWDVSPAIDNFFREYSDFLKKKENASLVQTMISRGNTSTARLPVSNQMIPLHRMQKAQRGRRQQPELPPKHQLKQQNQQIQRVGTRPNSSLVNARSSRYNRNLKSKKSSINKIGSQNSSEICKIAIDDDDDDDDDVIMIIGSPKSDEVTVHNFDENANLSANTTPLASTSNANILQSKKAGTEITVDITEIEDSDEITNSEDILKQSNIDSSDDDIVMLPFEITDHENTVHTIQNDTVQFETKSIEDSESSVLVDDISLKNLSLNVDTLPKTSEPEANKIICSENSDTNQLFCQSQSVTSVNVVESQIEDITKSFEIECVDNFETNQVSIANIKDIPKRDSDESISILNEQSEFNIVVKINDSNTSIENPNKSDHIPSIIACDEEYRTEMDVDDNIDSKPTENLNQLTEVEASNETVAEASNENVVEASNETVAEASNENVVKASNEEPELSDNANTIDNNSELEGMHIVGPITVRECVSMSSDVDKNDTITTIATAVSSQALEEASVNGISENIEISNSLNSIETLIEYKTEVEASRLLADEPSSKELTNIQAIDNSDINSNDSERFGNLVIDETNSVSESLTKSPVLIEVNSISKSVAIVEENYSSESLAKLPSSIVEENSVSDSQAKSTSMVEENTVFKLLAKSPTTIVEENFDSESQAKSPSMVEENTVLKLLAKSPTTIVEENFDSESIAMVEENSVPESPAKSTSIAEENTVPKLPAKSPTTIVEENSDSDLFAFVEESQAKSPSIVEANTVFELLARSPTTIVEENFDSASQSKSPSMVEENTVLKLLAKSPTTIVEENFDSESQANSPSMVEENTVLKLLAKSPTTIVEENFDSASQSNSPSMVEENTVPKLPAKSPTTIVEENFDSELLAIVEENSISKPQTKSPLIVKENAAFKSISESPANIKENSETKDVSKMNGAVILKNKSFAKLRTTRYNSLIEFPSSDEKNEQYDKFLEGLYCDPVKTRNVSKLRTYSNRRLNINRSNIQVRRLTISTTIHKILDDSLPIFEINKWKSIYASNTDCSGRKEPFQSQIQNDSNLTDQILDSNGNSNKCENIVTDLPTSPSLQTNKSVDIVDTTLLKSCDELENRSKITLDNSMLFDDYTIQTDSEEKSDIDFEKDAISIEMSIESQNEILALDSDEKLQAVEDKDEACSEQPKEIIIDEPEESIDQIDEPIEILEDAMREKSDIEIEVEHIDSRSSCAEGISTTEEIKNQSSIDFEEKQEIENQPFIFKVDNKTTNKQENVPAISETSTEIEQNIINTSTSLNVESILNEKSDNIPSIKDQNKIQNFKVKPTNVDIQLEDYIKTDHILEEPNDIREEEFIKQQPIQEYSIKSASESDETEKEETENVECEKVETEKVETEKEETEKVEPEREETENVECEKVETEKVETEKEETEKVEPEREESEKVESEKDETENDESLENGIESCKQDIVSKIEGNIALNVVEVIEESKDTNNLLPLENAQESEEISTMDEMVIDSENVTDELQTKVTDQNTSSIHPTVIVTSHLDRECHIKPVTVEQNVESSIADTSDLPNQSEIESVGSNIPIDYTVKSSAVVPLVEKCEENVQEKIESTDSQINMVSFSELFHRTVHIESPDVSKAITENVHCFEVEQLQRSILASTNVSVPLFVSHISSPANQTELNEREHEIETNIPFSSPNSQLIPLDYSKNLESDGNKMPSTPSLSALVDSVTTVSINTIQETEQYVDSTIKSNGDLITYVSQSPAVGPIDLSYTPNNRNDERPMTEAIERGRRKKATKVLKITLATDLLKTLPHDNLPHNGLVVLAEAASQHDCLTKIAVKSIEPYEDLTPPFSTSTSVESVSEIITNAYMNKRTDSEPVYISNEAQPKEIMDSIGKLKNDESKKRTIKVDKYADTMLVRKSTRLNPSRHAKEVAETNIISSKRNRRGHANEIIDQKKMDKMIEKSKSTICRALDTIEEISPCKMQPIESPQQIESFKPQYVQKPVDREALKDSFLKSRKDKKLAIQQSKKKADDRKEKRRLLQEKSRNMPAVEENQSNQSIVSSNDDEFMSALELKPMKRHKSNEDGPIVSKRMKRESNKHRSPLVMKKTFECICQNDRDKIIKRMKEYNEKIPSIGDGEDVIGLIKPSIPIVYMETRTTLIKIKKIFFHRFVDLMDQKSPDIPYLKELRDKLNSLQQIGIEIEENVFDDATATYNLIKLKCQECDALNTLTCENFKNFQKFLDWWSQTFQHYYNSEIRKRCPKKIYDTEESSDSNSQEKDYSFLKNSPHADKTDAEMPSITSPSLHKTVPDHIQRIEYHGDMSIIQSSSENHTIQNTDTISDSHLIAPITIDPSNAMLSFTSDTSEIDMDHINHTNNNTQKAIITNSHEDSYQNYYVINSDSFDEIGYEARMYELIYNGDKNLQVPPDDSHVPVRQTDVMSLAEALSPLTNYSLTELNTTENGENVQNVVRNIPTLQCAPPSDVCPSTWTKHHINKRNHFRRNQICDAAQMTHTSKNDQYINVEPDIRRPETEDDVYMNPEEDFDDSSFQIRNFELQNNTKWPNTFPHGANENSPSDDVINEQTMNSNNNNNHNDQLLPNRRDTIHPNVSTSNGDPTEFSITQKVDICSSIEANRMSFEDHDNPLSFDPNTFLTSSPKTPTCDRMHGNEADMIDPDGKLVILSNQNEQMDSAQQIASKNKDFPFKQPLNVSLSRGHSSRHSSDSKSHRSKRKNMHVTGDEEPSSHSSRSSHENGTSSSTGDQYSNNCSNVLQPKSQRLSKTDDSEIVDESDSNDNVPSSILNSPKYIVKNVHVKSKSNKSSKKHTKSRKSSSKNSVEVSSKVVQIKFKKMPPEEKSNRNSHKVYSASNKVASNQSSEWSKDDDEENNSQFWSQTHRSKTLPI